MNRMKRMEDLVVYFFVCICRDGSRLQFLSSCLLLPFFEIISPLKSKQSCFFECVIYFPVSFFGSIVISYSPFVWFCQWHLNLLLVLFEDIKETKLLSFLFLRCEKRDTSLSEVYWLFPEQCFLFWQNSIVSLSVSPEFPGIIHYLAV